MLRCQINVIRGDQQKKLEFQKALTSLRDYKQPIESIEDLDEEEVLNLSDDVKNALKNQFKEQGQRQGDKGGKQGSEQATQRQK